MANVKNRVETVVAVPAVETLPVRPHEHAEELASAICHTLISKHFAFLHREQAEPLPTFAGAVPFHLAG